MEPREFHYNPLGTVHGGMLATLLDTAAGCAVHTTLPAGVGYTSMDLSVKYLRPVTVASGTLRCVGTVLQRGRRTALAEARLTDAADRLVAHATSTCLLFDLPPAPDLRTGGRAAILAACRHLSPPSPPWSGSARRCGRSAPTTSTRSPRPSRTRTCAG